MVNLHNIGAMSTGAANDNHRHSSFVPALARDLLRLAA
jgi:hypothetical protein